MMPYIAILVLALAAGFVMTLVVRRGARKLGIVDKPEGFRKLQTHPIPRLGGVAIFAAFFLALVADCLVTRTGGLDVHMYGRDLLVLLGGATVILLIGVWDDVKGLRPRWKLLCTGLVAIAMYVSGYRIGTVSNPFGISIHLGILALPVTVFWFVGCMNAINLIDGLDGLAAGITVFSAATTFIVAMLFGNTFAAPLSIALGGATLGFLVFNFYPASIYLGDSGSLLLGFLLACIGLRSAEKSTMVVSFLIPVIALGLPLMDTTLAILRRYAKALPMSASDHQHIHHKLLEMGLSHRAAVLLMYGGCIMLAAFALLIATANSLHAAVVLIVLGLVTFLSVATIGRHELKLLKSRIGGYMGGRKERIQCRVAGYVASESMRQAQMVDDVWRLFAGTAGKMGLEAAEMKLWVRDDSGRSAQQSYLWAHDGNGRERHDNDVQWTVNFPLHVNEHRLGTLQVKIASNGHPLGPEIPRMLQLLTKAMAINIERLHAAAPSPAHMTQGRPMQHYAVPRIAAGRN
jgi:UDP-GlcNAc:undecaprenyl-phosphate GlcNAc-1-phosphate transferase